MINFTALFTAKPPQVFDLRGFETPIGKNKNPRTFRGLKITAETPAKPPHNKDMQDLAKGGALTGALPLASGPAQNPRIQNRTTRRAAWPDAISTAPASPPHNGSQ